MGEEEHLGEVAEEVSPRGEALEGSREVRLGGVVSVLAEALQEGEDSPEVVAVVGSVEVVGARTDRLGSNWRSGLQSIYARHSTLFL